MFEYLKSSVKRMAIEYLLLKDAHRQHSGPDQYNGLAPEHWRATVTSHGHLCWDGVDLVELAQGNELPIHVVSRALLERNYLEFKNKFARPSVTIELGTSYKTNPLPAVLKVLHDAGSYAEVISEFELWLAIRLGVPPERIIFNGPGKTRSALKIAISHGIKLINIDGLWEIPLIAELSRAAGRNQHVGVRVVSSVGWSGQFGLRIDDGEALRAFGEIAKHPELSAHALHLHLGTGVKDAAIYRAAVKEVLQFAELLQARFGINIECLDLGGGFPVPTVRAMNEWDNRMVALGYPARLATADNHNPLDRFVSPVMDQVEGFVRRSGARSVEVIFEPGRAITSNSQLLLLSVLAVKERAGGQRDVILNGGKNITMPLGWETHQIFAANRMLAPHSAKQNLYGPLCHPGDAVAKNLQLPILYPEDIIAIMDSGAYFIPNQMNFSNPRPAVLMIDNGRVIVIREQEQFSDIIRHDIF